MPREVITNQNYINDFANIAQVQYRINEANGIEIGKLYFQNAIRGTKPVGTITAGVDFPFSQYGTITINRTSEDPYSTNGQISSGTSIRYGDSITATFTLPSDYNFITIQKPTYSISHPTSSVVINNSTFNIHYVPGNGNNLIIDSLYGGYDHSADRLTLIAGVTNDNDFNIIASENDNFSGDNTIIPANSADPQALSIHDYSGFRTDRNNNGEFIFYYGYPDYKTNPVVRSQQTFGDVACILTAPEFNAKLADNNQNTITASVTETVPYEDLVGNKTFRVLRGKDNSFATFMRVGYTKDTMSKNFKMAEYPAAFNETTLHPRLYACSDYYPTNLLAKIPESNVVEVNIPGREGIITPSRTDANTDAYYLENPNAIQVNYTFKGKHNETNIDNSGTIQPDSKYFFTKINEYNSPRADVTFTISYTEAKDNVTYTHITEYKKGGYYAEHDVTTPPLDFDTRWDYDLNTGKYYYYINLQNNRTDGNTCRIASSLNRANAIDVPPNQVVRGTGSPTGTVTPSLGDGSLTVTGYYFYPENVWAKLTETFRLSHPYVSVPTFTLTEGTLGQVQYSLTNNDEISREYSIEYAPYASPPTIVATGICNGNATVTGTLSNTDRETTTKPRFRAATVVKTWKSDYSDIVVGDTSFEPAGITATYRPLGPSTLDLFLINPNYATFNYSFTGVLFNQDLSSVSGTIKSRQTALAYSISEGMAPAIGDMRKHYKLVGSLTYTEPSTNQEISLDTNYSYGGVFTSDEILLNDNYYSTDGEKGSGYYRQFNLSNRSALTVRYALNTTSIANLTTLNRNATVPFTYSTTTTPVNEYICLYYTDTTLLAYKKSMNASVAPALTPSFSATLGTPSGMDYPISFSFAQDRAQKCQVAFVVEGNDGVQKNFGPANTLMGASTYSDDISSFTNNRASLQLTLKGRTATTNSTLSAPMAVTLTLKFREPVFIFETSGLGRALVRNFNSFPVSANIIYAVDGVGRTKTATIRAKNNGFICNMGARSRVYAKVTFTIKDYYTGKTETVLASEANYSIGSLTARGSPGVVEEEQATYVAYNNPNSYSLTVRVVQTRYGSDGSVLGTNTQTKTIPANDGMEFKFQDSGTYQVYSVEYTTDGYVQGTGPTQTYGTPPDPDTTTTTTTTTTTE